MKKTNVEKWEHRLHELERRLITANGDEQQHLEARIQRIQQHADALKATLLNLEDYRFLRMYECDWNWR